MCISTPRRFAPRVGLRCAALAAGLASAAAPAQDAAPESAFTAEPIVVTAGGPALPASLTPGGVSVLTGEDLRGRTLRSLTDAFALVPGVGATADAPWGADANIRGLSRNSVLLLIDGCPVNTATDIGARFGLIDPGQIERIEILKGPISSLYGSGSLGGVVNVITRAGDFRAEPGPRGGVSASAGSNPAGGGATGFAEAAGPDSYVRANQSARDVESYEDGDGREVRNSQFSDRQTTIGAGRRWTENSATRLNLQRFEGSDIGIPGSGAAPLPASADVTYREADRTLCSVAHDVTPDGRVLRKSSLNLFYQGVERRVRIDEFPAASPQQSVSPGADHDTLGSKWINVLGLGPHDVTAGLDVWQRELDAFRTTVFRDGRVREDEPLPDATYRSAGAFAEDNWTVSEAATLNAGARLDDIAVDNEANALWEAREEEDPSWNAHLGGSLGLSENLRLKAVAASGYRAPSLEERYQYLQLGGGLVKIGDPELEPERSLFFESGLCWAGERVLAEASAFHNELDDLIGERFRDETTIVDANVDEARIQGLETSVRWSPWPMLRLYGNLAWAVGRDTRTDEYLAEIPPLNGLAGAEVERRGAWARAETAFAARQDKTPDDVADAPGWATVDLRTGCRFGNRRAAHSVFAGIDNVFDRSFRNYLATWRGAEFNEPGRSFVAGYEIAF